MKEVVGVVFSSSLFTEAIKIFLSEQCCITRQILALPERPPLNALSKLNNCVNPGG